MKCRDMHLAFIFFMNVIPLKQACISQPTHSQRAYSNGGLKPKPVLNVSTGASEVTLTIT